MSSTTSSRSFEATLRKHLSRSNASIDGLQETEDLLTRRPVLLEDAELEELSRMFDETGRRIAAVVGKCRLQALSHKQIRSCRLQICLGLPSKARLDALARVTRGGKQQRPAIDFGLARAGDDDGGCEVAEAVNERDHTQEVGSG